MTCLATTTGALMTWACTWRATRRATSSAPMSAARPMRAEINVRLRMSLLECQNQMPGQMAAVNAGSGSA